MLVADSTGAVDQVTPGYLTMVDEMLRSIWNNEALAVAVASSNGGTWWGRVCALVLNQRFIAAKKLAQGAFF